MGQNIKVNYNIYIYCILVIILQEFFFKFFQETKILKKNTRQQKTFVSDVFRMIQEKKLYKIKEKNIKELIYIYILDMSDKISYIDNPIAYKRLWRQKHAEHLKEYNKNI